MGSGLLKKANLLNQQKGLAFSNFIQKYNKKVFQVLTKQNNFYFSTISHGFDGESLLASYSTSDFWNGIITKKNTVYNFSQEEDTLNNFFQFFSFSMKQDLKSISIYSTNNSIILMCNGSISEQFIQDYICLESEDTFDFNSINKSYLEKYKANKYLINYYYAIHKFIKAQQKEEINDLLKTSLLNEISGRCSCFFNTPNCTTLSKDNNIKVILFSVDKIEDELLLNHLILNLKEVLGDYADYISVSYEGAATSFEDITTFFLMEK